MRLCLRLCLRLGLRLGFLQMIGVDARIGYLVLWLRRRYVRLGLLKTLRVDRFDRAVLRLRRGCVRYVWRPGLVKLIRI